MPRSTKEQFPLLLTATIDPGVFSDPNVVLTDPGVRLEQYSEVLTRILEDSPFSPVVFAENSGYPFDAEAFQACARRCGKEFEYLPVETDKAQAASRGKSYGEAVLITQATERSRLLQDCPFVYKLTGRVFPENAERICRTARNGKSEFLTIRARNACQTVFFKLLRQDYERGLHALPDSCDEKAGMDAEHAMYRLLRELQIDYGCFRAYPRLHGLCATNGLAYDRSPRELWVKDRMIRLGMFGSQPLKGPQKALFRFLMRRRENWFW